jgi:hypothetical protein
MFPTSLYPYYAKTKFFGFTDHGRNGCGKASKVLSEI